MLDPLVSVLVCSLGWGISPIFAKKSGKYVSHDINRILRSFLWFDFYYNISLLFILEIQILSQMMYPIIQGVRICLFRSIALLIFLDHFFFFCT